MGAFWMAGILSEGSTHCCTLVVPCYNEEQRLPVEAFRVFLAEAPGGVRLLFVNDGSRDGTLGVLRRLADEFPAASVMDQPRNMGKAEAVRAGMLRAIADGAGITGFWDADLATPLSELPRLLAILQTHPEVAILLGSRVRLLGRSVSRKSVRHYSGRVFATLASLTLSLPVYDTQCGAKLFRVEPVLAEVLAAPFHSRWIFDVELLARYLVLRRSGPQAMAQPASSIYEEPLRAWHDVDGSKLKATDSFKALGELMEIRRRYFGSGAR
jgi:dolichyl-phosphate beta-glucosyltransferase